MVLPDSIGAPVPERTCSASAVGSTDGLSMHVNRCDAALLRENLYLVRDRAAAAW